METINKFEISPRLKAAVEQGRKPGGCSIKATSELDHLYGLVHEDMQWHRRFLEEIETLRKKATTPPAKFKQQMIPPKEGYELVAVMDSNEVSFMWEHPDSIETIDINEWPLEHEWVFTDDLEKLGVRVEIA